MVDLVSLGELMLCLSAPKYTRLRQATAFNARVCGAQFNIAANVASLGWRSAFLSALPDNEVGQLAITLGSSYGVDMSPVLRVDARMGLIFIEYGIEPRAHKHIYDRDHSAASTLNANSYDWSARLADTRFVYCDGILPALNDGCAAAVMTFMQTARAVGSTVCFDVNLRESLWQEQDAAVFYRQALPLVDVLVTNRAFSEAILGFTGDDAALLRAYHREFGCRVVIMTYRTHDSLTHGRWSSVALADDTLIEGRPFDYAVVDRFGTGDAFFAGFLYGYAERDVQYGLDFGNAMCALAHTIDGDAAIFAPAEVEAILSTEHSLVMKR